MLPVPRANLVLVALPPGSANCTGPPRFITAPSLRSTTRPNRTVKDRAREALQLARILSRWCASARIYDRPMWVLALCGDRQAPGAEVLLDAQDEALEVGG